MPWFNNRILSWATGLALLTALGCKLGPDYERPSVIVPADWRWKAAEPTDNVPRGEWWTIFQDPTLNALEEQASTANFDLQAAIARVNRARAIARFRGGELMPTVEGNPTWVRYRTSGTRPSPVDFPVPSFTQEQWDIPFDLSYELDIWGRIRRGLESARHEAIAAEAAREFVLLTLQSDVAGNYFSVRSVDREIRLLEDTIGIRRDAVGIFEKRVQAGLGNEFEVQRALVEVASAEAELAFARRRRAELLNALAVLCGQAPPDFNPEFGTNQIVLPEVAPDLPSSLLERRPDVAEAERQMAARNAEIGVAKTAFFPSISLTASGGLQSGSIEDLFKWDSRTWGIGPEINVPVFQAGRAFANMDRARAVYEEAVANYRQRVLLAFRDVDDSLAALRFLKDQAKAREMGAESAGNATRLAVERYKAGAVNFLEVVDAEAARLLNELARIRIANEQLIATVRLVKALGGGWQED